MPMQTTLITLLTLQRMSEILYRVKCDRSDIALLTALVQGEEGLFFMRVGEEDMVVSLFTTDEMNGLARSFLESARKIVPFKILDVINT